MLDAKYIIYVGEYGLPIVQIFSPLLQHNKVAAALDIPKEQLLSAGFVRFNQAQTRLECFGESVSLGIEANPNKDTLLLQELFGA